MVNQKNKQTFSPPRVGEVSNLAGAECTINSKVYHSITYLLYMYARFSTIEASVFAWAFPLIGCFLNFFILAIYVCPFSTIHQRLDIILGLLYNGLTVFQIYVKMLKC